MEGSGNGNAMPKIIYQCPKCGKEFEDYECNERIYCSNTCRADENPKKHGMSGTRLYQIWCDMKSRCCDSNQPSYEYYGGRGIAVCDEWMSSFESFKDWALSFGYRDDLQLDRREVNDGYSPHNCRWVTRTQQMRNTRKRRQRNVTSKYKGVARAGKKWRASIWLSGKPKHLGVFNTQIEAARAYDKAARKEFGEFANPNFKE